MPTAAKLVAGLAFAGLGWLAAQAFRPLMPEVTQWGRFPAVCAGLGLVCGWRVMGARAGRGWAAAAAAGLSTAAVTVGVALVVFAMREMVLRSLGGRYGGVLEALVGVFAVILEFAARMGDPAFLAVVAAGGIAGGLAAEAAARRWR